MREQNAKEKKWAWDGLNGTWEFEVEGIRGLRGTCREWSVEGAWEAWEWMQRIVMDVGIWTKECEDPIYV